MKLAKKRERGGQRKWECRDSRREFISCTEQRNKIGKKFKQTIVYLGEEKVWKIKDNNT